MVKVFDKVGESVYLGMIGLLGMVLWGVMVVLRGVIKKGMKGID